MSSETLQLNEAERLLKLAIRHFENPSLEGTNDTVLYQLNRYFIMKDKTLENMSDLTNDEMNLLITALCFTAGTDTCLDATRSDRQTMIELAIKLKRKTTDISNYILMDLDPENWEEPDIGDTIVKNFKVKDWTI